MLKAQTNKLTPWLIAGLASCWGFVAGETAAAASNAGAMDFGVATIIAILPIVIGAFINIDRRLQRTNRLNQNLLYEQDALHAHCIVSTADENHRFSYVNNRLLELTGYRRRDLIGSSVENIYFEEELDLFRSIKSQLNRGENWSGETRLRRQNGSALWTHATILPKQDIDGRLIGTISVRTDITAVKVAASERELTEALHKISDEVYVFEPDCHNIFYMNERAMQRLGWDQRTYQTKSLEDVEPKIDRQEFNRILSPLLDGSTDRVDVQVKLGDRLHEASIQLIKPEAGRQRFVAIFRDVAERAEVEKIKEEFIATVSHELRTPLTSIKGALGLMLSGAIEDISEKSRSLLDIAHRNTNRLVLIVNDILVMEQIAAGKMNFDMEVGDLVELITEAIEANSAGAARFDVTIEAEGLASPAFTVFDQTRMMQVLTNILSNAMKFSHPGGKVIVALTSDGLTHKLSVQDFGVGIPSKSLGTIFDRFAQAANHSDRTGPGTGLGLSIVKAIVEEHGGSVSISSKYGKGTTFSVCLPNAESLAKSEDSALRA